MMLDRQIVQEVPYPERMSWELIQRWLDEIPVFDEDNPADPEWQKTPDFPLDLTAEGYGVIQVKDESVNPTGTAKDRPAWEAAVLLRDYASSFLARDQSLNGAIVELPPPRFTILTAGNDGKALAHSLARYGLPPPKLLVDKDLHLARLEQLRLLRADIYVADLTKAELTPEQILAMTNNKRGIDLTSTLMFRANELFYDWLAHEVFNTQADEVYVPCGSGRVRDNLLHWQEKNVRQYLAHGKADPRLQIPLDRLISMSILSAEPEDPESIADKLPAPFRPFQAYHESDLAALQRMNFTGTMTGTYPVREEYITRAHQLFSQHGIAAEPSGAAGLALHLQLVDSKQVHPLDGRKKLIINTGKGI